MRALLLCAALAGCVPLPYLTPPVKLAVGGGGAFGDSPRQVLSLRAGVNPQQLEDDARHRLFDLGAGYLLEAVPGTSIATHGAYLEGSLRLWSAPLSDEAIARLFADLHADLLFLDRDGTEIGGGAALGLNLELVGRAEGVFVHDGPDAPPPSLDEEAGSSRRSTHLIGVAAGEWSVGLFTSGAARTIAGETSWLIVGGLSLRLPASAGVLLVWL